MKKEKILNYNIIISNYNDLILQIKKDIKENLKKVIIAINPEKILTANKNVNLKNIINKADYLIPDGMGIVIASKLKKGKIASRITGIDMFLKLCELAEKEKYKIFIYGAKEEVLTKAIKNLLSKFPNLIVAGYQHGYEKDEDKIINKINKSKANILFVALGSPKQENFIYNYIDQLDINVFQGIGGSLDVVSGNIQRAPKIMQDLGLEWLFRLYKEPKRIFRQLKLFEFIGLVLFSKKEPEDDKTIS